MKLKNKLRFLFLVVALISTLTVTVFSLFYFSGKIESEALGNMRKNRDVADLIYNKKLKDIETFTQLLSSDKTIQVLTNFKLTNKLDSYLASIVERERIYAVSVLDVEGDKLSSKEMSFSSLNNFETNVNLYKNYLIDKALKGTMETSTELILSSSGQNNILSLSSACPIRKDNQIIGVVFVRFILNDNKSIVKEIKDLLGVEALIYQNDIPISYTTAQAIDSEIYNNLMKKQDVYEYTNIRIGGHLAQYKTIKNTKGNPIAVLGISLPAGKYAKTRNNAFITFILITLGCLAVAYILGHLISRNILKPVNELLHSVHKISEGDLTQKVRAITQDEIGHLSRSFEEMRMYLNEMISTIERANGELEEVNQNLENEVKKRTERIESLLNKLRKYLSPQLYDSILGGTTVIDIKSHARRKLTIFFSDIVSFTSTTESMEAEDLSNLLNNYLDNMAKIALKWGGTIDKFVGDAIMVFFGDPEFVNDKDHAIRAIRMAMEMMEKMEELREDWKEMGIERPLHIRVGINTGYCTVGNFGSENRMDYTIIGGNVNLASRLESSAEIDTIHISHETYSLIKDEVECAPVGEMNLKGIGHPVKTYKVVGEVNPETKKDIKYFKINDDGELALKNLTINPNKIEEDEAEEIIKSLKIAIAFTKGKLKYIYDEKNDEWKLIKINPSAKKD